LVALFFEVFCDLFDGKKTYVVVGVKVFAFGVAQTDNQVFHVASITQSWYNANMEKPKKVGAGCGIIVLDGKGRILLGLRNSDAQKADSELHGEGTWTMPGGKLEWGETFEQSAIREVKEETDLDVREIEVFCVQNDMNEYAHFVTIGLVARKWSGAVKTMEPDEIVEWRWFDFNALPKNIFMPSAKCIERYKAGKFYI